MLDKHTTNKTSKSTRRTVLLVLFFMFQSFYLPGQIDSILFHGLDLINNSQSGIISVDYQTKYFFREDTLIQHQDIIYYIDDNLINNLLFIQNGKTYILINHEYIYQSKNGKYKLRNDISLSDTRLAPYIFYFSRGYTLNQIINDSANSVIKCGKIEIDNKVYHKYKIDLPDNGEFSHIFLNLYFKEPKYELAIIESAISYLGKVQYDKIELSYLSLFNHINPIIYDSIQNSFNIFKELALDSSDSVNNNLEDEQYNKLNTAPYWSLPDTKGDSISLNNIKSKLILLDFWYVSCAPCLKTIPSLVKIDSIYTDDQLRIIGINVYDKDIKNINYIIDQFDIEYDIVLNGKTVAKDYAIKAYPSLLLIDSKTKEILWKDQGYSENLIINLNSIINQNLPTIIK